MRLFRHCCLSLVLTMAFLHAHAQERYRAGVLQVKFKADQTTAVSRMKVQQTSRGTLSTGISSLDAIAARSGVHSLRRIFRPSPKFEKAHEAFGLHLWYEIEYDSNQSASRVADDFLATGNFERVERVRKPYRIVSSPDADSPEAPPSSLAGAPNDPLFGYQWHYNNLGQSGGTPGADIKLLQAWQVEAGNNEVIVAVIDGGVDYLHPDLNGAMWNNADEIPGNNIDDDNNGYIDDVHGYGFGDNTPTIHPDFHGTHVAGTIGAVTNNSIGVSGIAGGSGTANGVRIMSCETFGVTTFAGFEDAFVYAADNGAVISQNSWGGGSTAIYAAIDYFIARAGFDNSNERFEENIQVGPMAGGVVVFAAGNRNSWNPALGFPASYAPVIAVASTDHNDVRSYFSNYGDWIDISAPGSQVYSTYPRHLGNYTTLSGTSMACPHVSGVAALIVSKYKGAGMKPESVHARMMETADNIYTKNSLYSPNLLGAGRLNAGLALNLNDTEPPALVNDLRTSEITTISMRVQWTATGGNGNIGKAARYDLRYSTSPITAVNFAAAQTVPDLPRPSPSGRAETFELRNLTPSTTYYIAMKVLDSFGNESALSNVVTAATLNPGIIDYSPLAVSETLISGASIIRDLTIRNIGTGELVVTPVQPNVTWLKFSPLTVTIQPGQTFLLPMTLSADGLAVGNVSQSFQIVTNDINRLQVFVPVNITVTSAPNLKVLPPEVEFGNVILPDSKTISITLLNNGTEPLSLTGFNTGSAIFTHGVATSLLNPGQSQDVSLTFSPPGAEFYTGTFSITTNDPDQPVKAVPLSGSGTTPPRIQIGIDSVISTVYVGAKTKAHYFTVGNDGGLPLNISARMEFETIPTGASSQQGSNEEKMAPGDMTLATDSPTPLSTIITDPRDNIIYGLSNSTDAFFRYRHSTSDWEAMAPAPFPVTGHAGSAYLEDKFYFFFADTAVMAIYNISLDTWSTKPTPIATSLVTSDGTNLYCAHDNQFMRYAVATETWGSLPAPSFRFSTSGSLAYNRGIIYGSEGADRMGFSQYTLSTSTWQPLNRPNYGLRYAMTVDPVHERIYVSTNTWTLLAYDIRSQSWRNHYQNFIDNPTGGMAFVTTREFQGIYIAAGNEDILFARYEPEHTFYWLHVFPNFATIAAGGTRQMEVDIEAAGLPPGTYRGTVFLSTNDPFLQEKAIGIRLVVAGAPDISVGPYFRTPDGYVGYETEVKFPLSNVGTEPLTATLQPPIPAFTISPTSVSLLPGESVEITAKFLPTTEGLLDSYMQITTNDPDEALVEVDLITYTELAPELSNLPPSINATVFVGQDSIAQVVFKNDFAGSRVSVVSAAYFPDSTPALAADEQSGYFVKLTDSPVPLTALSSDAETGAVYGQAINGNGFYRYNPEANAWSILSSSPVSAGPYAGGALLEGKIYVSNTETPTLGVYTIANDSWSTIPSLFPTANICTYYGSLAFAEKRNLVFMNTVTGAWQYTPWPLFNFTKRGGIGVYGNYLFGHPGDGSSSIGYYDGDWDMTFGGSFGQGIAIDPVGRNYFSTAKPYSTSLLIYSFTTQQVRSLILPFFSTREANMVYGGHPGTRGIYFSEGPAGSRFGKYMLGKRSWLDLTKSSDFALPGRDGSLTMHLKSEGLAPGTYTAQVMILSNDPLKQTITLPVTLHVVSSPDIRVEVTGASLEKAFIGTQQSFVFHVNNTGSEPLDLLSISPSHPELSTGTLPGPIAPGDGADIEVLFNPTTVGDFSGTMTLTSNDPDEPTVVFTISAPVYQPPVIASNPLSFHETMALNAVKNSSLSISNPGGYPLEWTATIIRPGGNALERALDSLNVYHQRITNKIPDINNFLEGETGDHIVNGGNDMYNHGNYISTNRQTNIPYSNKLIQFSNGFDGRYFTSKYPGLFVLAADANVGSFRISGQLGAGHTTIDTRWLNPVHEGYPFSAIIRSSSGPAVPSVHRLILLTKFTTLSGSYGSLPQDEQISFDFSGVSRIYYLVFSTASGTTLSDAKVMNIARAFLSVASGQQAWLSVSQQQGITPKAGNQNLSLTFNTGSVVNGDYVAEVQFTSNDPTNPVWKIPVRLTAFTNQAPVVDLTMENQTMFVNNKLVIPFVNVFSDPDEFPLTYFITSSNAATCRAVLNGNSIDLLSGFNPGSATITVTARDAGGLETSTGFNVKVERDPTVTGLEPDGATLTVFPNPTSHTMTISFAMEQPGIADLALVDLHGKEHWKYSEERAAGNHQLEVNTRDWAPGVYLLRFSSGTIQTTRRVVVIR